MTSTIFDTFSALDPQRERNQVDSAVHGGGGGNLTVTDGTHSVASVTSLTFSGATVSGSSPNATATISGGGGGAAIQPETGSSPIKISAFPNAAASMGSADTVTGLQGGANANFSQAQLLSTPAGVSGGAGGTLTLRSGVGDGAGGGGNLYGYAGNGGATGSGGVLALYAGYGGSTSGDGGGVNLFGGLANSGFGGHVSLSAGRTVVTGTGGSVTLSAGNSAGGNGGLVQIFSGAGSGSGNHAGSISLRIGSALSSATAGNLLIYGLPTSSAGLPSGAVWSNAGILTIVP